MFTIHRQELNWGGRKLVLETGKIARQADGAVLATYGDTQVLCTVVGAKEASSEASFFPLSVHYLEKAYAAGRIPGGYIKRESKPSDNEVLTSRLIDRPIRPLFPDGFFNEVQVICTVMSFDETADPDICALIGASAALSISGIPFHGPIGGARVGYIDGQFVLNPNRNQKATSNLDLVVAGTQTGVLMVESEASELSEDIMLGAVEFGFNAFQEVINAILELKTKVAKETWTISTDAALETRITTRVKELAGNDFVNAYKIVKKQDRYTALKEIKNRLMATLTPEFDGVNAVHLEKAIKDVEANVLRQDVLDKAVRIDGRGLKDIRRIEAETGVLKRSHGSALFTRGETQAIVVATLGTASDEQVSDGIAGEFRDRFMLHYNFPAFSVGECGRVGAPGRREVGHGKLAWRAINPLIPAKDKFAYTMRSVSEITESNGSSSMATVCGTSLALMDAGVPLARPIAGIAMGLIKDGDRYAVLSDILGDEDHLGDMDFKVAGTDQGITALQMDIKITSITPEIMKVALAQAKEGRLHILGEMAKAMSAPRATISEHAPKMQNMKISRDKIRDVIGSGGKVIREICEKSGAKVDIDEDGQITISGPNQNAIDIAFTMINGIVAELIVGEVYEGKVVKIADFGAFVNVLNGKDGMVHISELKHERVAKVSDVVNVGDVVKVKVIGIESGKVKLSMKALIAREKTAS
jgi:polyribonucleotide nucleotidyltransferase